MTQHDDARLLAGARAGNEKAFRQLVEHYHPVVFAVVRTVIGDRHDVEDVVQEVFIKVYRGLSKFRGDAKFSTWVYRIARNEAINAARKKVIASQPIEDIIIESPTGSRPDIQFHQKAEQSRLNQGLAGLDENYRMVLELRYLGERSYAEIGETMELPIGTVKSYIHRAKIELKRVMERQSQGDKARSKKS